MVQWTQYTLWSGKCAAAVKLWSRQCFIFGACTLLASSSFLLKHLQKQKVANKIFILFSVWYSVWVGFLLDNYIFTLVWWARLHSCAQTGGYVLFILYTAYTCTDATQREEAREMLKWHSTITVTATAMCGLWSWPLRITLTDVQNISSVFLINNQEQRTSH